MTKQEVELVNFYQRSGMGYRRIAEKTGISVNTVKSFCRNQRKKGAEQLERCPVCNKTLTHTPHKRKKKYCSDKCRYIWWADHPEARKPGKYLFHCAYCGKEYSTSRKASKYCSTVCFANARKKVNAQ